MDFEQLQQYAASLAVNSHVLSFLDDALQVHRQVMVEGEISVGVDTVTDRDNVTMYGVKYHVSTPTHTSASVVAIEESDNMSVVEVATSFLGDDSGLLSPAEQLKLVGLVLESVEDSQDV